MLFFLLTLKPATDIHDFGHSVNNKRTSPTTSICHCLACCYITTTVTPSLRPPVSTTSKRNSGKAAVNTSVSSECEPPSEAAAFVASASAAAFVLLAALLAVVLSSAALLTVASMVPMADAAAHDIHQPQATDYINLWHHKQQQVGGQRISDNSGVVRDDASRQKRQLFNKNTNREPGVVALTFSLIGGTISDARQAFRNVSNIVRDTISEAAKDPTATTAATDQMMMAAVNTADNEVGGGVASTTAATDQKMAGEALGKLFGRNYRGLRRLFDSELRSAVKNSPGNIRDFAVELMGSIGQSLRPSNLFSRGPTNGTMTTASRR
ncbi:PREDICTED: uncharacterized protein LOC107164001 isoform X2 [Diuraphis noxia]|uniref:uncharacterized protein LOC107164001 isoform X2 n=1 Tax=Diuraphis noxia TaxID=143948 RepID=UPI0007639A46|nr:PREDICTED: uncharacterized protein LOC107164001 isoform X2 [Diuraphis noxia]